MKYFLGVFDILDGEHEHKGAVIFEARSADDAYRMAEAEEYTPETDAEAYYFSFAGDGLTGCKNRGCTEVSKEHMAFLERVGLAYRA